MIVRNRARESRLPPGHLQTKSPGYAFKLRSAGLFCWRLSSRSRLSRVGRNPAAIEEAGMRRWRGIVVAAAIAAGLGPASEAVSQGDAPPGGYNIERSQLVE